MRDRYQTCRDRHWTVTKNCQPVVTTQSSAPTTKPPAPTTQPPAPTTQPPASTTKPPASTTQTPAPTTQPPASTTQQPASTTQPPAPTTQPPASTTKLPAPSTQPPVPTTKAQPVTIEAKKDTSAQTQGATSASKPTKPSEKTLKPSKPSTIDCDKDHMITVQDDKNINGVLVVKSCHATRFVRKPSRFTNVGTKFRSLVNDRLGKNDIRGGLPVNMVKVSGDQTQTEFHYTIPCDKSQHQIVINQLKDTCKDKDLIDTITAENQPDEDDSSSESDDETVEQPTTKVPSKATPQSKVTPATSEQSTQRKTTTVGYTKKPPATKRTVQVKNCDDDDNVRSEDDQTITGKIVVQDCPCEKRFKNNATRLAALSATLDKQLRAYYQKLYNTNINYKCNVKVLSGNSTHTVFAYTVQIPKPEHTRARAAFKLLCKDEEVKKTIETASIKHEGDDDSDSSSSEDHESSGSAEKGQTLATTPATAKKITIAPLEKPTQSEATQKPAVSTSAAVVTSKPTTKSGKIVKPSKPSTVDCDKDHTVTAQDDKNLQGVLVVKSCHASRFARKPSRCNHVGDKLGALLKNRLDKAGIKGQYPVNIVKTVGDKTQTEFHYTIPCDKSQHQTVIQSLKDSCKEKDFIDTVTAENQPDEDDSSSDSDEEATSMYR
ncbi:unnamed protein product [Rotaria sp. Silwood1]|nr:unnamed protein product [Rotaria sp. Silwood1]